MPDVTKDQFDAAAKRVMATAPPGLSRDQFFDLIDKEISSDPNVKGTVIGDMKSGVTPTPVEGDPSPGGFFRNAAKDTIETAGGIGEGVVNAIAHPIKTAIGFPAAIADRLKEITSDMHPIQAFEAAKKGNITEAAGQLLPVGELYHKPAQMAADVVAGRSAVKAATSAAKLPEATRQRGLQNKVDRHMPNKSAVTRTYGPKILEGEGKAPAGLDRYMPNTSATIQDAKNFADESGRDLGTATSGAEGRPAGPWDRNGESKPTAVTEESNPKIPGHEPRYEQPKPDATKQGPRSEWPPEGGNGDWHAFDSEEARKAAPQSERDSARALHRDTGEMDSRYDYLTDPNNESSMFTGPEAILAHLVRGLVREKMANIGRETAGRGVIGRGIGFGKEAAKIGAATGNVVRAGEKRK